MARGKNSQKALHQFKQKATIELSYDPRTVEGNAGDLILFYYNESNETWAPLSSWVDRKQHVLYASTDHLTVFDFQAVSWEAARRPDVKAGQTALFTGAATYSYPLNLPEGPGGLKPGLTLSYNSQVVDGATLKTQASWVGMGWSLETGYIRRTIDDSPDGDYSLVVNGMSYRLLKDTAGVYHTEEESFWRLQKNESWSDYTENTTWTVWDKQGTEYTFGDAASIARYPFLYNTTQPDGKVVWDAGFGVWLWPLVKVKNIYGKELTYTYTREQKQWKTDAVMCGDPPNTPKQPCPFWIDNAMYPATITYPNGRYQIVFERGWRGDYDPDWLNWAALRVAHERERLEAIRVMQDSDGNGSYETQVRKYAFNYASGTAAHIFNGYHWAWDVGTLTLLSVVEYGTDNAASTALPATTFSYGADMLHLQEVNNGQGGKVSFTYAQVGVTEKLARADIDDHLAPNGSLFSDWGRVLPKEKTRPGGMYRVVGKFNPGQSSPPSITVKKNGVGFLTLTATTGDAVEGVMTLPADTGADAITVEIVCPSGCSSASYYLEPILTRYRVSEKTLTDLTQNPAKTETYQYRYNEAATNDRVHSAMVADANNKCTDSNHEDDLCYSPAYTEFRGHSSTTEISPEGRITTTWFNQSDGMVGKTVSTQVMGNAYYQRFTSMTPAMQVPDPNWAQPTVCANCQVAGDTLLGEPVMRLFSPSADLAKTVGARRVTNSYPLGRMVQFQFRVSGVPNAPTGPEASFFIDSDQSGSDYQRWGFSLASDGRLMTDIRQANTPQTAVQLIGFVPNSNPLKAIFQRERWYLAWLALSNGKMLIRIQDREDATVAARYEIAMPDAMKNHTWRFGAELRNGTVWMDDYREGDMYRLDQTAYATTSLVTTAYPKKDNLDYKLAPIRWTYPVWQKSFTYEGGVEAAIKMVKSYYDAARQGGTQYGNLTRTEELEFNGSAFAPYRGSETIYRPMTSSSAYLVGLPSEVKQFRCASSGCDLTNLTTLTAYAQYLYDGSSNYTAQPTVGKLTGERRLLYWFENDPTKPRYADTDYAYDAWGNPVLVKKYTQEGTDSVRATGGEQRSVTCYGAAIPNALPDETCTGDGYYTYPLWQKNALDQMTSMTYNYTLGLPSQVTDPNQAVTSGEYDIYGRLVKIVRPYDSSSAATVQISYHESIPEVAATQSTPRIPAVPFWTEATQKLADSGVGVTYTDFKVRKFYNGIGELIQTQQVGVKVDDPACATTTCTVVTNRKTEYVNGVMTTTQAAPYVVATPSGYSAPPATWANVTVSTFDGLGRPAKVKGPDQTDTTSQRFSYALDTTTLAGQTLLKTTATDPASHDTYTWQDVWGRTVRAQGALGPVLAYNYDPANRLTSVAQYASPSSTTPLMTTGLAYDIAGRKTQMTDPDMGTWAYAYDALGNLTRQQDARGQRICLYYDALNRLTGKHYRTDDTCPTTNPSLNVSYTYDSTASGNKGIGRRTGMSNLVGGGLSNTSNWTYDLRGRVTAEYTTITDGTSSWGAYSVSQSYDSADRVTSLTYPSGEVVKYDYLPQGQVKKVESPATSYNQVYLANAAVDEAGRVTMLERGNGTKTIYTYNEWSEQGGRLSKIETGLNANMPVNPTLQKLSYVYDLAGNITQITDGLNSNQNQCFTYDAANRLTRARTRDSVGCGSNGDAGAGSYDESYAYLANGNLGSKMPTGIAQANQPDYAYTYNSTHPHAVEKVGTGPTPQYTYDANGNMITRVAGGINYTLGYDAENRLVSLSGGTLSVTYVYDGDGKQVLVKKVENIPAVESKVLYVGSLFEISYAGAAPAAWKTYYMAGANRVAMRNAGGVSWLYADHLGSTTCVVAAGSSSCAGQILYKAWGERRGASGNPATDYRYTGQREADAGLYYYNARWYDPALGRFAQADTIIPEPGKAVGFDRYAYVNNNPVRYNDPSGHCPVCIMGIAMFAGAIAGYAVQVGDNLSKGMDLGAALTTDISANKIAAGAFIAGGAILVAAALPVGVTALGGAACADGDCTNEGRSIVNGAGSAVDKTKEIVDDAASQLSAQAQGYLQKLQKAGDVAPAPPGAINAQTMAELHNITQREFGLYQLADGSRVLVRGERLSVISPLNTIRTIAHTHSISQWFPSSLDIEALKKLGQQSASAIITEIGRVIIYYADGSYKVIDPK